MISSSRITFALLSPLALLISLGTAIALYLYNITITSEILEVTLKTDWSITKEFIDIKLLALVLIIIIAIASIIVFRYSFQLRKQESIILMLTSLILITPALILNHKRNNTIVNRAPYTLISATKEYRKAIELNKTPRETIAEDATSYNNDSLLVILILGESLRNDHLSINGYSRKTTPRLEKRSIYSFKNTKSIYTYTAASIPQILTRADSAHTEAAHQEESLISIFNRAGYQTHWLANQVPDYTYSSLTRKCDTTLHLNANTSTYSDVVATDQNLLDQLPLLVNQTTTKPQLYILHSMGSHWYYNYRCPEAMRIFKPITASRSFANNSKEEMINAYDNSVFFTDYFIDETIKLVENKKAILIYISDHGEALGEDGIWLHAFQHETLHRVACLIWMSDKYKTSYPEALNVKENTEKATSSSHIFHTMLDAGRIKTSILDQNKSLLSNNLEYYY